MSKSNSTAVRIDLRGINAEFPYTVDALAGKGFVQLEDVNVLLFDATELVEVQEGWDRSYAHLVRSDTSDLGADESSDGLQAMGISPSTTGEDCCRCAIGDLRPAVR